MTRAKLEKLRGEVAAGLNNLALLRIDTELAQPEVREWRVKWDMLCDRIMNLWAPQEQTFLIEKAAYSLAEWCKRDSSYRKICIESRTPAGPWERAE